MYYGGHSNETFSGQVAYNMQLAYFLTIAVYMVLCGLALLFRSVPGCDTCMNGSRAGLDKRMFGLCLAAWQARLGQIM